MTFVGEGMVLGRGKYEPGPMERDSGADVELFYTNKNWTRSCGIYCPMVRRKSYEDAGVACYWGQRIPIPFEVPIADLTYQELYQWTIGHKCWNEKCPCHALYEFHCSYLIV
jgi:hypothetical protein